MHHPLADSQVLYDYLVAGLGYAESNDTSWLTHHDDFASLLFELNKKGDQKKCFKEKSMVIKKKESVHVQFG